MIDLQHVTTLGLQRMRRIASDSGWDEIAYDCREEEQRRMGERTGR